MRWQFDWGDRLDFLTTLAAQTGTEPAALSDRPELFEDLYEVAEAFAVLSAGRTLSLGLGAAIANPIALAEIDAYCRLVGIADTAEFSRLIRAMDAAYLERVRAKRAADTTPATP
ncbi:phage tail assembly chaperone [Thalassobaculum sp.]|uniref:phage tail assembly chaperone n=1 Tax=Thalassobaculum sp. TaxID=2022740 RepID=UPI003B5B2177